MDFANLPNGLYVVMGGMITAIPAWLASKSASRVQQKIARENADKDITLQTGRLLDERVKSEVEVARKNLKELHCIISLISLENSQTMSYFHTETDVAVFRERYLQNCHRLHEAMAIADLYYPKFSSLIKDIYSQTNIFWGYQENLMRTDIKTNESGWQSLMSRILTVVEKINELKTQLHSSISDEGGILNRKMQSYASINENQK